MFYTQCWINHRRINMTGIYVIATQIQSNFPFGLQCCWVWIIQFVQCCWIYHSSLGTNNTSCRHCVAAIGRITNKQPHFLIVSWIISLNWLQQSPCGKNGACPPSWGGQNRSSGGGDCRQKGLKKRSKSIHFRLVFLPLRQRIEPKTKSYDRKNEKYESDQTTTAAQEAKASLTERPPAWWVWTRRRWTTMLSRRLKNLCHPWNLCDLYYFAAGKNFLWFLCFLCDITFSPQAKEICVTSPFRRRRKKTHTPCATAPTPSHPLPQQHNIFPLTSSLLHHLLFPQRRIRPVFAFQEHAAAFQALCAPYSFTPLIGSEIILFLIDTFRHPQPQNPLFLHAQTWRILGHGWILTFWNPKPSESRRLHLDFPLLFLLFFRCKYINFQIRLKRNDDIVIFFYSSPHLHLFSRTFRLIRAGLSP